MSSYALTFPQLMNQALSCGLPEAELLQLRRGHEFAMAFSDGVYRAQAVPLLNHLVRTASILLAERQPVSVMLGGMLHAAYILHYFDGSIRQHPRTSHREHVRRMFGEDVDSLIVEYNRMGWYSAENVTAHRQRLDDYPARMRHALTVRLANDLEDSLDLAMAYSGSKRAQRRMDAYVGDSIALARQLSLHRIAEGLEACREAQESAQLPGYLVLERKAGYELPKRRLRQASLPERALIKIVRRIKRLGKRH